MRHTVPILLLILLGACAFPTPFTVFSLAADGISYAATGRSVTDHAVSAAMGQDCVLTRLLRGASPCIDAAPAVASPVIYPGDVAANWTGVGTAQLAGFAPATEFYALRLDDGSVEIFAHDPHGRDGVLHLVASIGNATAAAESLTVDIGGSRVSVADLMV